MSHWSLWTSLLSTWYWDRDRAVDGESLGLLSNAGVKMCSLFEIVAKGFEIHTPSFAYCKDDVDKLPGFLLFENSSLQQSRDGGVKEDVQDHRKNWLVCGHSDWFNSQANEANTTHKQAVWLETAVIVLQHCVYCWFPTSLPSFALFL